MQQTQTRKREPRTSVRGRSCVERPGGGGERWLPNAIREAGETRFRPILLTSLTTFAGLTPLLLEKSLQAQFLIPMAISLAFGVLFATGVILILVPVGYYILEDVKALGRRVFGVGEPAGVGVAQEA